MSMAVEIRRKSIGPISVPGEMWIDGQFECFTLEPPDPNPTHPGHPTIPAGKYRVILSLSPHFGYITPEVLDVPGRSGIRWHIANRAEELEGCTAVGETCAPDWVGQSTAAFRRLMVLLNTSHDISVTYLDPPVNPPSGEPV